ncbi:MAG TPA: IPT/TIG domain-containing protein [Anaeromyxobacteraceae bacterium]|nr:IPT/TIG domain-containing protein [Anaeromyxobacteraceae bacterium]
MKGRTRPIVVAGIGVAAVAMLAAALFVGRPGERGRDGPAPLRGEAARRQSEALRSIGEELDVAQARSGGVAPPSDSPRAPDGGSGPPGLQAAPAGAPSPEEAESSARLVVGMQKLARDLEYNANAGLPEPPQQAVVAAPEPWRPEQGVDDRQGPVIDGLSPRGAPAAGGAQVTIRGRNLRPAQVMFGGAPARVVRVTGEAVVVVVAPRGAPGPVTVAVTNDDGTFALSPEPCTYGR